MGAKQQQIRSCLSVSLASQGEFWGDMLSLQLEYTTYLYSMLEWLVEWLVLLAKCPGFLVAASMIAFSNTKDLEER